MPNTIDFSGYISAPTRDFTGRRWAFERIADWLASPIGTPTYLVGGGPGSGKTALAARLAQISKGVIPPVHPRLGPACLAYAHFCQAGYDPSLNPLDFVRHLSLALASRYPGFAQALAGAESPNIHIETNIQAGQVHSGGVVQGVVLNLSISNLPARIAFDQVIRKPLEQMCSDGFAETILVLVDSLDEAQTFDPEQNIAALLAQVTDPENRLPAVMHFLLTGRFNDPRLRSLFRAPDLDLIANAPSDDKENDIIQYGIDRLAGWDEARVRALAKKISDASQGNFLYARYVLDEILEEGHLPADLETIKFPEGLESIYRNFIERELVRNSEKWDERYGPILGLLAVARNPGLTGEQLSDICGISLPLTQAALKVCAQYLAGPFPGGPFTIYHQSFRDFLCTDETFQVFPADAHRRLGEFFAETYGEHWDQCEDGYAFQFTPYHLVEIIKTLGWAKHLLREKLIQRLNATLLDDKWMTGKLAQAGPASVLADYLQALDLALRDNDLVMTWQLVNRHRKLQSAEKNFDRVKKEVDEKSYQSAFERTQLHASLPNSQAMERLWIAWVAATNGQEEAARNIVELTLKALPRRGFIKPDALKVDGDAENYIGDAIQEAILRLLTRISQSLTDDKWLKSQAGAWLGSPDAIPYYQSLKPEDWGDLFDAKTMQETVEQVLGQWHNRSLDGMSNFRSSNYFFQKNVAAAIFNSRQENGWLYQVNQVIERLALDDYPSYREMALAWVISAIVAQPKPELAQGAMALALRGIFKPGEIGFMGDSVAAILFEGIRSTGRVASIDEIMHYLEYWESTTQTEVYITAAKPDDLIAWRRQVGLPIDPWAHQARRLSAVASVVYQHDKKVEAQDCLDRAGDMDFHESYAGYRVLTRLSLSCRWLEWGEMEQAQRQVDRARQDADHMLDPVLKLERVDLINKMESWLHTLRDGEPDFQDPGSLIEKARAFSGMERAIFIEFIASISSNSPEKLNELLPLALDDVTATDAVFGRMVLSGGVSVEQAVELTGLMRIDVPELPQV